MFPEYARKDEIPNALPHARGGVSDPSSGCACRCFSSPRPWGCFRAGFLRVLCGGLFPTPGGVFLCCECGGYERGSLPHARGGVSITHKHGLSNENSSPRPGGCFRDQSAQTCRAVVFPTPVGVFPGGISGSFGRNRSSPRPGGCFYASLRGVGGGWLFPTPGGVFLNSEGVSVITRTLPHARGGCFFIF